MKRIFIFCSCLFLVFFLGCDSKDLKDNQVYIVDDFSKESEEEDIRGVLNTEGNLPFQEYKDVYPEEEEREGKVLLTISPDGQDYYFMSKSQNPKPREVIKGDSYVLVDIFKKEKDVKDYKTIVEGLPFVTQAKWNKNGDVLALLGGQKLSIYDTKKNKFFLEDSLRDDRIIFFSWSPKDGNKLYAEHPNLANGSIYYLDSQKKVEAYETKEDLYYKGRLDNNYYYATKWYLYNNSKNKESINTVIVDKKANVVKVLAEGRFRDSYKKSLLQVGENGFGLYYTKDINKPEDVKLISKKYIYDTKFVDKGDFYYIIEKDNPGQNRFQLVLMDSKGKEIKKIDIRGSQISLLPNGKYGFVASNIWEKIDFIENKRVMSLYAENLDYQKEAIYKTIRSGLDLLCRFEINNEKDYVKLKKYFIDTLNPQQWAYFDIYTQFNENKYKEKENLYKLYIEVIEEKLYYQQDRASVKVRVEEFSSSGLANIFEYPLELKKEKNEWFITGISTFPDSPETQKIYFLTEKYVQDIRKGKLFPDTLESKNIEIGQIQFWRSALPHLAYDLETANACKIYLRIEEKGKSSVYKLILEKKSDEEWLPLSLEKEKLSFL